MHRIMIGAVAVASISGCASGGSLAQSELARGGEAYATIAPAEQQQQLADRDYRIGPQDTLSVSVFQEPELSTTPNSPLQVNANGNINMPLIGSVPAAGKTTTELSAYIAERLGKSYLRNPQVSVSVEGSVSQKVTVQGEVTQAGVYEIKGRTTLLEALALAKGETRVAALSEVVVFRSVNGQRMGALFDVKEIRRGRAEDPEIRGNDVVVVGLSKAKSIWRDVISTSPLLGIFRPF